MASTAITTVPSVSTPAVSTPVNAMKRAYEAAEAAYYLNKTAASYATLQSLYVPYMNSGISVAEQSIVRDRWNATPKPTTTPSTSTRDIVAKTLSVTATNTTPVVNSNPQGIIATATVQVPKTSATATVMPGTVLGQSAGIQGKENILIIDPNASINSKKEQAANFVTEKPLPVVNNPKPLTASFEFWAMLVLIGVIIYLIYERTTANVGLS